MEIKFEDYGSFVVDSCQLIRDGVKSIEPLLDKSSTLSKKEMANIDRGFVRLTLLTQGLREIVYPTPSTGEFMDYQRKPLVVLPDLSQYQHILRDRNGIFVHGLGKKFFQCQAKWIFL